MVLTVARILGMDEVRVRFSVEARWIYVAVGVEAGQGISPATT